MKMRWWYALGVLALGLAEGVSGQLPGTAGRFAPEILRQRRVISAYSGQPLREGEWRQLIAELEALAEAARAAGDHEAVVAAGLLRAQAAIWLRQDQSLALLWLNEIVEAYAARPPPNFGPVYSELAALYSAWGDEEAIQRLIALYRAGPAFDAVRYDYAVGVHPGSVKIVRPRGPGTASTTLTVLDMHLRRAALAPGKPLPMFAIETIDGVVLHAADLRGRHVLVDFWGPRWPFWAGAREAWIALYETHADAFEILGVCLDARAAVAIKELRAAGGRWPQAAKPLRVARDWGVTGEALNMLAAPDGRILAWNVNPAQVRRYLSAGDGQK
ncbi:MAG: hypothetical protein K9N49_03980 [Candidatus Marinimicrobia bacterium]|nr:hypothetical protein [Candidatus Neomarinimicrobiota bacterium]